MIKKLKGLVAKTSFMKKSLMLWLIQQLSLKNSDKSLVLVLTRTQNINPRYIANPESYDSGIQNRNFESEYLV